MSGSVFTHDTMLATLKSAWAWSGESNTLLSIIYQSSSFEKIKNLSVRCLSFERKDCFIKYRNIEMYPFVVVGSPPCRWFSSAPHCSWG